MSGQLDLKKAHYLTLENVGEIAEILRYMLRGRYFAVVTSVQIQPSVSTHHVLENNDPEQSVVVKKGMVMGGSFATLKVKTENFEWSLMTSEGMTDDQSKIRISPDKSWAQLSQVRIVGDVEGAIYGRNQRYYTTIIVQGNIDSQESQAPEGVKGE